MTAEEMKYSCYRENVAEKTGQERAQEGSRKHKTYMEKLFNSRFHAAEPFLFGEGSVVFMCC